MGCRAEHIPLVTSDSRVSSFLSFADTTEWVVAVGIGGAEVSELTHVLNPSLSLVHVCRARYGDAQLTHDLLLSVLWESSSILAFQPDAFSE